MVRSAKARLEPGAGEGCQIAVIRPRPNREALRSPSFEPIKCKIAGESETSPPLRMRSQGDRRHLYLALRQKNCTLGSCRAVSEVASHVFPDRAFRDMPSETARSNRSEERWRWRRCPAAERYPPARADSRRYRARPGRRRCVRPGRAHPADLDPVPPRRGQAGAAGARSHPRQHVDRPDRADRPRLQLFFAPRQHRRGPEQHPADAGALDSHRRARGRNTLAADAVACADGRLQRRRAAEVFRRSPGQSGPDRASDRSPPQEHDGPRNGDRSAAGPARTRPAHAGGSRGQRRTVAPRGADAVADQPVAPNQAHRARRGRQRPFFL